MFLFLESLALFFDHPGIPALVVGLGVECASVLEFEDLFLDVGGLVVFGVAGVGLLEVELVEIVSVIGQQLLPVQKLSRSFLTSYTRSSSR